MDLADFIAIANHQPALPFLVIGGYAVAAHAIPEYGNREIYDTFLRLLRNS